MTRQIDILEMAGLPDRRLYTEIRVLYLDLTTVNAADSKSVEAGGLFELLLDVIEVALGPQFSPGIIQVSHTLATDSPGRASVE